MSPPPPWHGCHGVRLRDDPGLAIGQATGEPLLDASVAVGDVAAPDGDELWSLRAEVGTAGGAATAEQRLWRQRDGTLVLRTNRGAALAVDPRARAVVVDGAEAGTMAQLVTAYGLPLLLHDAPCVVLHGAAAAFQGSAIVVAGRSGRGKSSVLTRLVDLGWAPISEDLCTIDVRAAPVVWPGPPWIRRFRGEPGPAGAPLRFETEDKAVWDIEPRQPRAACALDQIVVLDEPGGDEPALVALSTPEAIAELAQHAVWLAEDERTAAALFSPVARVAAAVPVRRLRFPRRASWLDALPAAFDGLTRNTA